MQTETEFHGRERPGAHWQNSKKHIQHSPQLSLAGRPPLARLARLTSLHDLSQALDRKRRFSGLLLDARGLDCWAGKGQPIKGLDDTPIAR